MLPLPGYEKKLIRGVVSGKNFGAVGLTGATRPSTYIALLPGNPGYAPVLVCHCEHY